MMEYALSCPPLQADVRELDWLFFATGRLYPSRFPGGKGRWLLAKSQREHGVQYPGMERLFARYMRRIKYTQYESTDDHYHFVAKVWYKIEAKCGYGRRGGIRTDSLLGWKLGPTWLASLDYKGRKLCVCDGDPCHVWQDGEVVTINGKRYKELLVEQFAREQAAKQERRARAPEEKEKRLRQEWLRRKFDKKYLAQAS